VIEKIEKITLSELEKATGGKILFGNNEIIESISTSSNEIDVNTLFIPIKGERFDAHDFIDDALKNGATGYLCDREIVKENAKYALLVNDTRKALMDIASFYIDKFSIDVIALTGSVGKTTTKEFVANVLSEKYSTIRTLKNYNNEIGMPFTVFSIKNNTEKAIIEMGMSNFGEIEKYSLASKPDVAIITNIGVSHIEYLKSQEGILKAKSEIFSGMKKDGVAILNGDDKFLWSLKDNLKFKTVFFGIENEKCDIVAKNVVATSEKISFTIDGKYFELDIMGKHNVYNALASYAVAKLYDMSDELIQKGFNNFKSDGIRQSIFDENGIKFINDCYNASPQSVKTSVDVLCNFEGRRIAILGDMGELGENSGKYHAEVGQYINEKEVDLLITVGSLSKFINNEAKCKKIHFESNNLVAKYLKENAKVGDVVLIKGSRFMKMEEIFKIYTDR